MIPARVGMQNSPQLQGGGAQMTPQDISDQMDRYGAPWVDQFNQHILLTVQALQRLHSAFDGKFSR
jgi:hypothetical protein